MKLAQPTEQQLSRIQAIFSLNALHGFLHVGEKVYAIQVEGTITYHWPKANEFPGAATVEAPRIEVSDRPRMTFEGESLDNVIEVFRQWAVTRFVRGAA